uniref:Uncharacterized protein n=1 Tax=Brassica oleracea TaxID=3712 RepID=A0A3P6GHP4_BRAOL|nr:unnamed protein product [Brassica oleracea]
MDFPLRKQDAFSLLVPTESCTVLFNAIVLYLYYYLSSDDVVRINRA